MPNVKKKNAPETPALEIKPELLDELVKGPMTPEQFEANVSGIEEGDRGAGAGWG